MDVVSLSPLRVGSLLWQPRAGAWRFTVIAKATMRIVPGESCLAETQEDLNEDDNYWDDDTQKSLFSPSDFAPFKMRADVLLVNPTPLYITRRVQIVSLAMRDRLPAIYPMREFAEVGGLMTYGTSQRDEYRKMGVYAGRILKGAKPAELPVEQSTKFEFIINLQTARALGLEMPATLLARADEVIE